MKESKRDRKSLCKRKKRIETKIILNRKIETNSNIFKDVGEATYFLIDDNF